MARVFIHFRLRMTHCLFRVRIQVQITTRTVGLIATAAVTYSLGHGLRTFAAVPRPSPLSLPPSMERLNEYQLTG